MADEFKAWYRDFSEKYAPLVPNPFKVSGKTYFRFMELDATRAQPDRTIEAVLSTAAPVARGHYFEVLRHDDKSVDLSRAQDGLPLLWAHNQDQQIGLAENVRVFQGALRARLRFSESARGEEIWKDVQAGIIRGISIGYHIDSFIDEELDQSRDAVVATRWTPFEASCVAVPADIGAGIGRALESGTLRELPPDVPNMDRQHRMVTRYQTMLNMNPEIATEQRDVIADIEQRIMAVKSDASEAAFMKLVGDTHVAHVISRDSPDVFGIRTSDPYSGQSVIKSRGTNMENFSLCRAVAMQFDPGAARAGGPELEIMQDAARRAGKRSDGGRFTLPEEALFTRAVTKGGTGGNLVPNMHIGGEFIPALRERLIVGRMGATLLTGLTGDLQIPKQLTDSAAGWIAGDGSDQVGASDPTYSKITMAPVTIGVRSTLSRKMLLQGDPNSELLLRNSLAFAVAKALDQAAINGSGTSNVPKGILNQTGINSDTYALAGAPSFSDIVDMEGALMGDNSDTGNLAYATTGALAAGLKKTEIVATTGQMIWSSTAEAEGRMNGYRAIASNLMPAGYILFGNWSELIVGLWSGLDFTTDPFTRASYGDVVINLLMDCNVAVRHAESFAELHEAAA